MIDKKSPFRALILAGIILALIIGAVYFLMDHETVFSPSENSGSILPENSGATHLSGAITNSGILETSGSLANSGSTTLSGEVSGVAKLSAEEKKEIDKTMKDIDKLFEWVGK